MQYQFDQKGLKLEINFSNDFPLKIWSDGKRYKQVLYNLLGNALKFTYKGAIKVHIEFLHQTKQLITKV
jgi:signal transduction histidine kinase